MNNFTLADEYATDTVGLILYLEKRRSGVNAEQIFESTKSGNTKIHILAMVLADILYLSEKGRISANLSDVFRLFENYSNFRELPLNKEVLESASQMNDIPELHDRLIAASARHLNLALITNDAKMANSAFVTTIW